MNKKNTLVSLIAAASIAGCGGGGSSTTTPVVVDPILTKAESLVVMAKDLTDVKHDIAVQVGFSPLQTVNCDNLGSYQGKSVCQVYNVSGVEGVPKFSPNGVDLLSRVGSGTKSFVETETKNDLKTTFLPVLNSDVVNLNFNRNEPATLDFKLRGTGQILGNCDILNSSGTTSGTTGTLVDKSVLNSGFTTLQAYSKDGFLLPEGTYDVNCSFSDSNGLSKINGAAHLQVLHVNSIPVISSVASPLELIIGKNTPLGGVCNDAESGVLALTPIDYTVTTPDALTIVRSCTDGIATVTYNQVVSGRCEGSKVYDKLQGCVIPVNNAPVISSVVSPLEGIIGQSLNLGGVCNDVESGILPLTPTSYTPTAPTTTVITRICTDGVNTVNYAQSVLGKCAVGYDWNGNACQAPNLSPVITAPTSLTGIIGQSLNLGATCNDPESGVLPVTPSTYLPLAPGPTNVGVSCTDGVNTTTANISVTASCPSGSGYVPGSGCVGNT